MDANDTSRHGAKDDNIRDAQVSWRDKTTFSLDLEAVSQRFHEAGVDRTLRTLQRYCEQGHLKAAKYPSETGSVWYVDPASVETKIEEIKQVQAADERRHDAARRAQSHSNFRQNSTTDDDTTSGDSPRQANDDVARRTSGSNVDQRQEPERQPTTDNDDRYVSVPVEMVDVLTNQFEEKDRQIERRDSQIRDLVEAHKEDRKLLGVAIALIHGEEFTPELNAGERALSEDSNVAAPASETKPIVEQDNQAGGV